MHRFATFMLLAGLAAVATVATSPAQEKAKKKTAPAAKALPFPPKLPGDKLVVTESSPDMLKPPADLREGIAIAKTPPTIDFAFVPGQDYPGKPWSNWGDSIAANGKYYLSIGDHLAPAGNGFVYEYDPAAK